MSSLAVDTMGELLIPLFRIALRLKFYLRGCVSVGKFYRSKKMTTVQQLTRPLSIIGYLNGAAYQQHQVPQSFWMKSKNMQHRSSIFL